MGWLARLFNRKKKEPGQGSGRKNKRPWQPWKWKQWKEEQAKQAEKPEESMSIDWGAVFGDEELEATPFGMMPKADKVNKAMEEYDLKTTTKRKYKVVLEKESEIDFNDYHTLSQFVDAENLGCHFKIETMLFRRITWEQKRPLLIF